MVRKEYSSKRTYPQDLLRNLPPKQEGKSERNADFSAFALSLQGASHVSTQVPCQDYSDIRILNGCGVVIGGIADGVGSCPLSHWGAYIAVCEALDYVEERIRSHEAALGDEALYEVLNGAFKHAERMVAQAADAASQAVRNLQSTLTVALYDGSNLYCCHVGDDGVVAQQQNGIVKLATNRLKGEEASSVYPLQTGRWEITKVRNAVAGFVMATDGVLDAFAMMYPDYNNINYSNRIYYPFMEPALYGMTDKKVPDAAKKTLDFYRKYLESPGYRGKVTDDLTFVAVTSPAVLEKSVHPEFSVDTWNAIEREHERKKAEALGYSIPQGSSVLEALPDAVPEYPVRERAAEPVMSSVRRRDGLPSAREQTKKKSDRKSPNDRTFLLLIATGILLAVLIAVLAFFGLRYFRQRDKAGETGSLNEEWLKKETEIQTMTDAENSSKIGNLLKASDSDVIRETEEELTKFPESK